MNEIIFKYNHEPKNKPKKIIKVNYQIIKKNTETDQKIKNIKKNTIKLIKIK